MSYDLLKQRVDSFFYDVRQGIGHKEGHTIAGCCGSTVAGGTARCPMGINLAYNGVKVVSAKDSVEQIPDYNIEPYLDDYYWHEHNEVLEDLGISYTLVIADSFYNEDEDDDF